MPLKWFLCPDKQRLLVEDCLKDGGCRLGDRCSSRSFLMMAGKDRPWDGRPSCTQCISGTMHSFLKIKYDYTTYPDSRAFMVLGTQGHKVLEDAGEGDDCSELEMKFQAGNITGIADGIETEKGKRILYDTKTAGSFKIMKSLGFFVEDEPIPGEYWKSGKRKGEQKTRKVLKRDDSKIDRLDWERQTNFYRMEYERLTGDKIDELRIQCIARDGGTWIAHSRGVFRNLYFFKVRILPDAEISEYFNRKRAALIQAVNQGYWNDVCTKEENWDGIRCERFCDVAEFCPYGKYLKHEKEAEEVAIKGISEIRRLPRLGKIRLGIKKVATSGKEYPAEVDYFICDPQTPSELENTKIKEEFDRLYGEKPKSIRIMFPVANPEVYFPQFYKRYGSGTSLKCKGDGMEARCGTEEFAAGLKILRKDEMGLPIIKCEGKDCMYYKKKECSEDATLQILLPELPGAGVWQITTGSFHSIVNLNSCIDYIIAVCGRAHMIPLQLERRMQETAHDGKKAKHYILHINMDFRLAELQKFALIEPTRMMLELPVPEEDKEEILLRENIHINPAEVVDVAVEDVEPVKKLLKKHDRGAAVLCADTNNIRPKTECGVSCPQYDGCPAYEAA